MENKEQYIFLLGGHDLEMEEIRKIPVIKGLRYYDEKSEWGTELHDY